MRDQPSCDCVVADILPRATRWLKHVGRLFDKPERADARGTITESRSSTPAATSGSTPRPALSEPGSNVLSHYVERGSGPPVVFLHGNGAMVEDMCRSVLRPIPLVGDAISYTLAPLIGELTGWPLIAKMFAPHPISPAFEREYPMPLALRPLR
jgi:hypothetical protein